MPLFLSEEELERCSGDASLVAEKADVFIRDLYLQIEAVKAQADASAITSEQTCSLLEQKFISLSDDFSKHEVQNGLLSDSLEKHLSELAEVKAEKHQLHVQTISLDGDVERLKIELSEHQKSKRQLLELVEQKDSEIAEKNATIQSYLDRIISLTNSGSLKEAKLLDMETELVQSQAKCNRLGQEKELIERHNIWLNDELTDKVNDLIELRRKHAEFEAEMSAKLANVEKECGECSKSLKWNKDRVRELESKLTSAQEELCLSKNAAAAAEERLSAEISTVTKLAELYKESADEWSRKAGELEGVIKALEMHLNQVEGEYKEKLEKEESRREEIEKVAAGLKEKLLRCEDEIENARKSNELSLVPLSSFQIDSCGKELLSGTAVENDNNVERSQVPSLKVPFGISGTALAASLLRDGWSLAKMYEKYQEAADALRHEQLGRKHSEMVLDRVLFEIQEKANIIFDERAEYERMVEAYKLMEQKLQQSLYELGNYENTIRKMKADLKRHERDYRLAQKEIADLEKQVAVLLKECQDVQVRYGAVGQMHRDDYLITSSIDVVDETATEKVISERLKQLTFKDMEGLVEQNVKLRTLVRALSNELDERDSELKGSFEEELQKHKDEAAEKVEAVLKRSEEQGQMIESLHSTVSMYKRLYEEQLKVPKALPLSSEHDSDDGRKDLMVLFDGSQKASKLAYDQAIERARKLEVDLSNQRSEVLTLRQERDKLSLEANLLRERLDSLSMEFKQQRDETNGVLSRNVEFSQLIVDYQRRLRENADSLNASEELCRKLSAEVSILKQEKDILINSEKRASEEVLSLSQRVHQLQGSLDTIQSAEEVREGARLMERRKREEYVKHLELEWAEAKKELQEEKEHVRTLMLDREQTLRSSMEKVEEVAQKLADVSRACSAAEARATVAEVRCAELEAKLDYSATRIDGHDRGLATTASSADEVNANLKKAKEEIEILKEEVQANKSHMMQYKEIANMNEAALKQMESAHEKFKAEADKLEKSLQAEVLSLKEKVIELENDSMLKNADAASVAAKKDKELSSALAKIDKLREENSVKLTQMTGLEMQITLLKEDLDSEYKRWRSAQSNYERQVILQSETIQELTKISQALATLQNEALELRKVADSRQSEIDVLKAQSGAEKTSLVESRDEAERKYHEANEQNKILHSRVEAMHIKLAETVRSSTGDSSGTLCSDPQGDDDLQKVIAYLRRSKEIAETEISLLKQERLRLQSQLESALKASETAQSLLNAERANSREIIYADEEFKTLKLQVREMSLLRESNMQLREENKHNFEECQKYREMSQKVKMEIEDLNGLLREKDMALETCQKEIEMNVKNIKLLEQRISELNESSRNIDPEDYHQTKENLQQIQAKLREKESELDEIRRLVAEKNECISCLEHDLENSQLQLIEVKKKVDDALQTQVSLKAESERQKKLASSLKKRVDTLSKEKEELIKDKQAISKQMEDLKSSKKLTSDTPNDQNLKEKEKEKDTRIQMLERTLERDREDLRKERDDHRKEKSRRQKTEKQILDLMQKVQQEKKQLLEIVEGVKHRMNDQLEANVMSSASLPSDLSLDKQATAYLLAADNFEEAVHSALNDGLGSHSVSTETSPLRDAPAAGQQVTATALNVQSVAVASPGSSHIQTIEEREKWKNIPKPEARKMGRRLVRPRLESSLLSSASGDAEISETEGSTDTKIGAASNETEPSADLPVLPPQLPRKRQASVPASELQEETLGCSDIASEMMILGKRPKDSSHSIEEPSFPSEYIEKNSVEVGGDDGVLRSSVSQETADAVKNGESDSVKEEMCDQKDPPVDDSNLGEMHFETNETVEEPENPKDSRSLDESLKLEELRDASPSMEVEDDREEGELVLEGKEQAESGNLPNTMELEPGESQCEPVTGASASVVHGIVTDTDDGADIPSPEILNDENNDDLENADESIEVLEKSNENEHSALDSHQSMQIASIAGEGSSDAPGNASVLKQDGPSVTPESEEGKEVRKTRSTTTINLSERARQMAALRQAGVVSPPLKRGQGRAMTNVRKDGRRGGRGGRGGRGASSGE